MFRTFSLRDSTVQLRNGSQERIRWLVKVAESLKIPIIVTAEDIERNGPTMALIRDVLPRDTADLNKVIFGLASQPEILQKVQATGKEDGDFSGLRDRRLRPTLCVWIART